MTYILLILVVFADEPDVTKLIGSNRPTTLEVCQAQSKLVIDAGDPFNKRKVKGTVCFNLADPTTSTAQ